MSDDLVQAAQRLAESSYKLLKRTMESKSDSELEKIANDGFFSSYSSEEKELARSILRERGESSAAKDTTITARHNTGKSLSSDEISQAVLRSKTLSTGTVKWFNNEKGFGFISNDDGSGDVFVHFTAIQSKGFRKLEENQKVTFDVEQDPKNPSRNRAANVKVVE